MFGQNSCFFCFAALMEHACKTFRTMVVKDTFMQIRETLQIDFTVITNKNIKLK